MVIWTCQVISLIHNARIHNILQIVGFAATIAYMHEFNNILQVVGFAAMIAFASAFTMASSAALAKPLGCT